MYLKQLDHFSATQLQTEQYWTSCKETGCLCSLLFTPKKQKAKQVGESQSYKRSAYLRQVGICNIVFA